MGRGAAGWAVGGGRKRYCPGQKDPWKEQMRAEEISSKEVSKALTVSVVEEGRRSCREGKLREGR
jgi:hypothetical protein